MKDTRGFSSSSSTLGRSVFTTTISLLALSIGGCATGGYGPDELPDFSESSRFVVVVADLEADERGAIRMGEQTTASLRNRIDELPTHRAMERSSMIRALRHFDVDTSRPGCATTLQLAGQLNAQISFCGQVEEDAGDTYRLSGQFMASGGDMVLEVPEFTTGDPTEAAVHIAGVFTRFIDETRYTSFCRNHMQNNDLDRAISTCTQALEANPATIPARLLRGQAHQQAGNFEAAMRDFGDILAEDPRHPGALEWSGYTLLQEGQPEEAREYYVRFLEVDPDAREVRGRIAFDLAQGGDPVGALRIVEEGLERHPDSFSLILQAGNYAFAAGTAAMSRGEPHAEFYEAAIRYFEAAMEAEDPDLRPDGRQLRNVVAAHLQLDNVTEAIRFGREAIESFPEHAGLRALLADALQRQGEWRGAVEELDRVIEIDPDYGNIRVRQAQWLLEGGFFDEAMTYLEAAEARGEQTPDVIANIAFGFTHRHGVQLDRWSWSADRFAEIRSRLGVSGSMSAQLAFWEGYSHFQRAQAVAQPQTVASANESLPLFEQALRLIREGRTHAEEAPSINFAEMVDAIETYITIQDAIIRRGGERRW